MLFGSHETLLAGPETLAVHRQEHAERSRTAERARLAGSLSRADRAERWARRFTRLSARLERLARAHRTRLT